MKWENIDKQQVSAAVAKRLTTLLAEQEVAWFVSGGSNIGLEVETMWQLGLSSIDLSRLSVLLVDERFGPVGHAASNWQHLRDAGFIIDGPQYIEPFTPLQETLEAAVTRYESIVASILDGKHYGFVHLGMGPDGHISGILPGSPAINAQSLVYGYEQAPYQRLTTTFSALRRLDEAVLVAYGEEKWPELAK